MAMLAAHGLRVKSTANHYKTFFALRKLDNSLEPHGAMFDEMRGTRNDSVYDATANEARVTEHLSEAREAVPESLAALRTAILAVRPGIAARLPHIR